MNQQEEVQEIIKTAIDRQKKQCRSMSVVRFTAPDGSVRHRIYRSSSLGQAMKDCKVGHRVELLGHVAKFDSMDHHPLRFYPQNSFRDEYNALPLVVDYLASIDIGIWTDTDGAIMEDE
jgi:hypothetical protein